MGLSSPFMLSWKSIYELETCSFIMNAIDFNTCVRTDDDPLYARFQNCFLASEIDQTVKEYAVKLHILPSPDNQYI